MYKLVDVVYHHHSDMKTPEQVLLKHEPSTRFAHYNEDRWQVQFVKHLDYEGYLQKNTVQFAFFKSRNRFWYIPFATHRYIKKQQPDVVLIEGLVFPLQLLFLKLYLGNRCKIIVQHHGEKPFRGIKRWMQKAADRFVDAYLFTAKGNAEEWIDKDIIAGYDKCKEVLEASTNFKKKDKPESLCHLHLQPGLVFLWVGRLDANKDPMTVINAFEKFLSTGIQAQLYIIFQESDFLPEMQRKIDKNTALQEAIHLIGKIPHQDLEDWYSAADFYISASHKEGSGYALLEAMACGCIPIVTEIPSFRKITGDGAAGFLYPAGDKDALVDVLNKITTINIAEHSKTVIQYFENHLTFKNIADDILEICASLVRKK